MSDDKKIKDVMDVEMDVDDILDLEVEPHAPRSVATGFIVNIRERQVGRKTCYVFDLVVPYITFKESPYRGFTEQAHSAIFKNYETSWIDNLCNSEKRLIKKNSYVSIIFEACLKEDISKSSKVLVSEYRNLVARITCADAKYEKTFLAWSEPDLMETVAKFQAMEEKEREEYEEQEDDNDDEGSTSDSGGRHSLN